jgi:hypothetical protein
VCCRNVPHDAGWCRFWTLLAGAGHHKGEILATIVDLARAKLICNHDISARARALGSDAVLAVVDVLLTLDFEPRRQVTRDREAKLVASHMRIALSRANVFCTPGSLIQTSIDEIAGCSIER